MKTPEYKEKDIILGYPIDRLGDPFKMLFLDIETTGLSPSDAAVYMIGCGYFGRDGMYIKQFFADDLAEEQAILDAFASFLKGYDTLITFNGNKFDIPFLEKRASLYNIDLDLAGKKGLDIYKRIRPYRALLSLPDMKQKSLERFLGVSRIDRMSGRDLITVYKKYSTDKSDEGCLKLLLEHNHDDVAGLPPLMSLLAYPDVVNGEIKPERAVKNNYKDYEGATKTELIIEFTFDVPVPEPVSTGFSDCYMMLGGKKGKIRVAILDGTLKFFYPDYKSYYYLPAEDRAIHKSAARYVDEKYREQAKAENCYVKVTGQFLPEWQELITPAFRNGLNDKTMYFELSDEIKNDPDVFRRYAGHLMDIILKERG
jgi:uncharacterized protein YprB with RNaseH-like and TPR domain